MGFGFGVRIYGSGLGSNWVRSGLGIDSASKHFEHRTSEWFLFVFGLGSERGRIEFRLDSGWVRNGFGHGFAMDSESVWNGFGMGTE